MGTALYRRYRSTSFNEVIGQDHITTTLKNSLTSGSISHAYLFTGPRGVGKTSVARILAYAVNGLDYSHDGSHLDVIEIDAASNRRIDEIRELRERVHIAPTSGKYKVYIIDEVHMLTREAFNALLKTLEEPPEHVIFILATTDYHKLPETIISRCITFTFRPITEEQLAAHLKYIAKNEKLDISKEALDLLALHGDGSFRDSISLLDQIKHVKKGKISAEDVETALGLAPHKLVYEVLQLLTKGDPAKLHRALEKAYTSGASESKLAQQLSEALRKQLISGKCVLPADQAVFFMHELLDVPGAPKPRAKLELALLTQLFKSDTKQVATVSVETAKPKTEEKPPVEPVEVEVSVPPKTAKAVSTQTTAVVKIDEDLWQNVLQKLKLQNNTLYGIARMAHAELDEKKLLLTFSFPFHFKQVTQSKNKSIIAELLKELSGGTVEIDVQLKSKDSKPKTIPAKVNDLESITNIFGNTEVIES